MDITIRINTDNDAFVFIDGFDHYLGINYYQDSGWMVYLLPND